MPGTVPQIASVRRAYGGMCKSHITDDKAAFEEWKRTGDELYKYGYNPKEVFGYDTVPNTATLGVKVAKTAEAMQQLGSRLAPLSAITRLLRPRNADPALMARTEARSLWLNYTPTQTRFMQQRRQAVNDALCWGGGCLWTGLDAKTGLTTSIWDPRTRTLVDGGAKMYEDVRRISRKRIRARAEAIREYPEAAEILMKVKPYDGSDERDEMRNGMQADKDRICYWECYYNHGITQYAGGSEAYAQAAGGAAQSNEDKAKMILQGKDEPLLCLVTDDGELFWTGPWPVKFWQLPRDGWPVTFYDLYTGTVPTRPHSPLEAGLGVQRLINHITRLMSANAKASFRASFATRKQNAKGPSVQARDRVMNGADISVIEIDFGAVTDGQLKVGDFFEKVEWSKDFIAPGIQWLEYLDQLYERLTPLSQFLNTGAGATQDRSATATEVRDRNTMTRVEDMRDLITEADNTIARKECFMAAGYKSSQQIAEILPEAAVNWGFLTETPDANNPKTWVTQLTGGIPLGMLPPIAQQQVAEQAQKLAVEAYSLQEVIYNTDYEIEASSSRRKDVDQRLQSYEVSSNSTWPIQLQSGDPRQMAIAYWEMADRAKLQGQPPENVLRYQNLAKQLEAQALLPPVALAPPGVPV